MDMRWDEYVDMFGFTPAEYIDSPQYKAKYGENQVIFSFHTCNLLYITFQKCWHDHIKNKIGHFYNQNARRKCYAPG